MRKRIMELAGLMALALMAIWSINGMAVTVNPTSNVLGDSANTVTTLVYRDSNGDHSSRDVSVRSIIPSDTTSSRNHAVSLTSTALLGVTPGAAGDLYVWINSLGAFYSLCVASGTGQAAIVMATATTLACRQQ